MPAATCPGCSAPTVREGWEGHDEVRPAGQYESIDRVLELTSGRVPLTDDPLWWRSGAPTPAAYAAWAPRTCGLACLRAVLGHWEGSVPTTFDLVGACQPYGVYDAGGPRSPGLRYRPFLRYLEERHGIPGEVVEAPIGEALAAGILGAGGFLVWSVHFGIRFPDRPPPSVGGHLVLVHGVDRSHGSVAFCNPSGHTPETRAARLPLPTFAAFAADRGMALARPRA